MCQEKKVEVNSPAFVDTTIRQLEDYIKKGKERLITETRSNTNNRTINRTINRK